MRFPHPKHSILLSGMIPACALAFLAAGAASAAERPASPYKVTISPATATRGPIVKVETSGPVSNRYQAFDTADDTTFDFTGAHIAGSPEHPMQYPVRIGEQARPPKGIRIIGGVFVGGIPLEFGWFLSHAFGAQRSTPCPLACTRSRAHGFTTRRTAGTREKHPASSSARIRTLDAF